MAVGEEFLSMQLVERFDDRTGIPVPATHLYLPLISHYEHAHLEDIA